MSTFPWSSNYFSLMYSEVMLLGAYLTFLCPLDELICVIVKWLLLWSEVYLVSSGLSSEIYVVAFPAVAWLPRNTMAGLQKWAFKRADRKHVTFLCSSFGSHIMSRLCFWAHPGFWERSIAPLRGSSVRVTLWEQHACWEPCSGLLCKTESANLGK